jgi:melibiose permease/lactose/raffinose/galactose permease
VTVLFVREPQDVVLTGAHTGARELSRALFRNDQLLWAASAYLLFMVGYGTTGAFGLYFFKYVYGDENVFPLFALFVGVGQLAGFALFPWFSARWRRGRLYTGATLVVVASYVLFIVAPMNLVFLGVAAFSLFFAASFIQLLMIVFQADTIEYGQVKLGQRNNAVTFALQPFINKTSGAMNTAIVGAAVILSGINDASGPQDMTAGGIAVVKVAMMVIPGLCIVAGYLIWRAKFVIDEEMHARLVAELDARGALAED